MCFKKIQTKRLRIKFFAPYAVISKPYTCNKHYLDNKKIVFDNKSGEEYANHIEMAGLQSAAIISYGSNKNGTLKVMRHAIYPTLRMYPNNTHSSLDHNFNGVTFAVNGKTSLEIAKKFTFDGIISIDSLIDGVEFNRKLFPAHDTKALIEIATITNTSNSAITVTTIDNDVEYLTKPRHGHQREVYRLFAAIDNNEIKIEAHSSAQINIAYIGCRLTETIEANCNDELIARRQTISTIDKSISITTPNNTVNTMLYYAKLRAAESIYKTKGGLMHSPGGGGYYAAVWTNDQCEYVNPLFGYMDYSIGIEQSINCYNLYKKYINPNHALITSIIAEGDSIWHKAKDRGDSAMYAYGVSRFLLSYGDKTLAKDYLEYIRSCLTYTLSQINKNGVIASDSDELEGRFITGNANLSTSCLAYDALISASYLESEIGSKKLSEEYHNEANMLGKNINAYFNKIVEGFDTYMYCAEETNLRSWICLPLVMGIFDKAVGTTDALLSPNLLSSEGLLTRSGEKTYWDRSTLYALRGMFYAGMQDKCYNLFERYSTARLLGEHIPYAVEAFPEGNQAHLSAESGLYVRIITEGIMGYRPTGFNTYTIKPNLPKQWGFININNFKAHGKTVDISITAMENDYTIKIDSKEYVIRKGEYLSVRY